MVASRWTKLLTAAVLAVFFVTAGNAPAWADAKCEERIHKLEKELHEAERKHGEHSKQADAKRHELEKTREKCGHHDHDKH